MNYRINGEAVIRHVADEILLVPIRGDLAAMEQIYVLNPVSEYIWKSLEQKMNSRQIRSGILDRFQTDDRTAENDLNEFLDQLQRAGLIEKDNE